MSAYQLAGVMLASALVTFDGSATSVALSAIGREFEAPISRLQWIGNAPLIVMTALLLPSGGVADRFGRLRALRAGLLLFAAAAVLSTVSASDEMLVAARFVQGAGAALILPASLAALRSSAADPDRRTRLFGKWAAVTGAAGAVGPLMAGAFVDWMSWRAVFVASAAVAIGAVLLVGRDRADAAPMRHRPLPLLPTVALVVLAGAAGWLLMRVGSSEAELASMLPPSALVLIAGGVFVRGRQRDRLIPGEILRTRNCLPANAVTFGLYFGLFGLSFLVPLYVQRALEQSALRAALVLFPVSLMLLLAEAFGRRSARVGTRVLVGAGTLAAAAGLYWIAAGPHPLAFWSRLVPGAALFGLGLSAAVSAVTHLAVAAVPEACAGAASGLNHAVVRAAGFAAIALLGSMVAAPELAGAITGDRFTHAMMVCAGVVAAGGVAGSVLLRDTEPGGLARAA